PQVRRIRGWLDGLRPPGTEAHMRGRLVRAWEGWCSATPDSGRAGELGKEARVGGHGLIAVEAQVLRGLHELAEGNVDGGVTSIRRACRMARVEGAPDLEVLSGIALARARRFQGRPQLALRILRTLSPHAPPSWRRWICWEAVLGGARFPGGRDDRSILGALLRTVDRSETGAGVAAEPRELNAFAAFALEARQAAALLAVRATTDAPKSVAAWLDGQDVELPLQLHGLAFAGRTNEADESCAMLLVRPGKAARRVLARAIPLAQVEYGVDETPASSPTRPRTDAGLAMLAAADGAMTVPDYFEAAYEYTFERALHGSMLNMHVKRMRERLGEAAQLIRESDTLELRPAHTFLLRDPAWEPSIEDRLLSALAQRQGQSASDLAKRLRTPLRTVQRLLSELQVEAGVSQTKEGRSITYAVEDTTFSEPTRSRHFDSVLET
ncbi:MAG: hypothetical protein AAF411_26725, partial [Myxococcota bacterium]